VVPPAPRSWPQDVVIANGANRRAISASSRAGNTLDAFGFGLADRHVVITGGEPCIHDLTPLTSLLEQNGFSCQIETSGTHEVRQPQYLGDGFPEGQHARR
jgi:hypothetical protein